MAGEGNQQAQQAAYGGLIGTYYGLLLFYVLIRGWKIHTFAKREIYTFGKNGTNGIWMGILVFFILGVIGAQIGFGRLLIDLKCGEDADWLQTIFLGVILPNSVILILFAVLMHIFTGWKAPFSNTFGYAITSLFGIKRHFTNILKSPLPNMLKQIIEDKSLLINEITPDNFDEFMKKLIEEGALEFDYLTLAGAPKDNAPLGDGTGAKDEKAQDAQQSFVSLYKLVVLKDLVSEFIWYSLVGGLVLTILNNTIEAAEASCTYDPEAAKAMADALAANNKNLDNIANQANEEAENDDFGEEDE